MANLETKTLPLKIGQNLQRKKRVHQWVFYSLIGLLTLFPIIRILWVILTTGSNNPSNDDINVLSIMDRVLNGTYLWRNLFRDTFFNAGHSSVWPILTQIAGAYFFHWNIYYLLFFGWSLAVLSLFLIHDALTHFHKGWIRYLWLPLLAFLLFSPSQISAFEFDLSSLPIHLNHLGLILGVWGLVRFEGRWWGLFWMALGGIIASWSWAGGPLVWPVFLMGMLLIGCRKPVHLLTWFLLVICALWPHFQYFLSESRSHLLNPSTFSFFSIIQSIGWPFSQDFSLQMSLERGWVGLFLSVTGLGILFFIKDEGKWKKAAPSLMLLVYGLLTMILISSFRTGLAPWYTAPFMFFWIGMVGFIFLFLSERGSDESNQRTLSILVFRLMSVWSLTTVILIFFFYGTSNATYVDKIFYLRFRNPASVSCLQNYSEAPTYCEQTLFLPQSGQFFDRIFSLGRHLERHRLSVFSPTRRFTLQGDFILDRVRLHEEKGVPDIFWSPDLTVRRASFDDYRHLNLFLHSPNAIEWKIDLPPDLKKAELHSAVAVSRSAPSHLDADGMTFEVRVEKEGEIPKNLFRKKLLPDRRDWEPFSIPLTSYRGRTITLYFTSDPGSNLIGDWAMYRYPYVEMIVSDNERPKSNEEPIAFRPSNTELSPSFPPLKEEDFRFDIDNRDLWELSAIKDLSTQSKTGLAYKGPLDLCLSDYTHFYFRMAASKNLRPRTAEMVIRVDRPKGFMRTVWVPLLNDGEEHAYTYDLKLLELDRNARLTGFKFKPVNQDRKNGKGFVSVKDLRLIKKDSPKGCS